MTASGLSFRVVRLLRMLGCCVIILAGATLLLGAGGQNGAAQGASPQAQNVAMPLQNGAYCEASPEVKAAMKNIVDQKPKPDAAEYEIWLDGKTATEALLKKYPNDYFVQSQYVYEMMAPDPSTSGFPSEKGTLQVIAEYKKLHQEHPDDPAIEYLYAKTLIDRDTPQAIQLLNDALRKNPAFPWPHEDLIRIYAAPNFLDAQKASANAQALISACPATPSVYSWLRSVRDTDFIRGAVPKLQALLQSRTDDEALGAYPLLWSLEFKSHPRSDYEALRKQVAADVARIRGLNLQKKFGWWSALNHGYQVMGDQKEAQWAQDGLDKMFEGSSSSSEEINAWFKKHPFPKPKDSKQKTEAFYRDELKATAEWAKKSPNSVRVWDMRMTAMKNLSDVPVADAVATLDGRLAAEQRNAGPFPLYWWTYYQLADFASQENIEPQRELKLAEKALETIASQWENIPQTDLNSTKDDVDYYPNFYWPQMKARGLLYEAQGYTRLKQADKALDALGKANLELEALESDMTADESRRTLQNRDKQYHRYESQYWQGRARVAELQGRNTDAMAYYQSALLARMDSDQIPAPGDKDPLKDQAHELWAKLGGTENAWSALYTQPGRANQQTLEWETVQEPLPSFVLTDLHGKAWKPSDLNGKVVFLNFWASW